MLVFGILRLASFSMDCSCIAPLTPAVIMIRGFVFQPLFCIVLISGSCFVCFVGRKEMMNILFSKRMLAKLPHHNCMGGGLVVCCECVYHFVVSIGSYIIYVLICVT